MSREQMLAAVRRHQPAAQPLPAMPALQADAPATLEVFGAALQRMGGRLVEPVPGESLAQVLAACHPESGVVVSATPELPGTRALPAAFEPAQLEDVDVGVVRAAFGVAETGSVFVSEREFGVNALGFLPQHLVVLLDPARLLPGLTQAFLQPGFFEARYAALMTGPSATADIEGILIRGAQGIRSLTVIAWPEPA